jgi:hypothetical protein
VKHEVEDADLLRKLFGKEREHSTFISASERRIAIQQPSCVNPRIFEAVFRLPANKSGRTPVRVLPRRFAPDLLTWGECVRAADLHPRFNNLDGSNHADFARATPLGKRVDASCCLTVIPASRAVSVSARCCLTTTTASPFIDIPTTGESRWG